CAAAKLVIELDGNQHKSEDAKEYDSIRTQAFESAGLMVLRFKNDEIEQHFRTVCQIIDQTVQERLGQKPPAPS
ncbi:MAG: endonuclease domain-containing protein, partial [Oscillospiraceae bacterium]|nr:endonuclease domain-containing protein [Oscillospiraceae bacterium]